MTRDLKERSSMSMEIKRPAGQVPPGGRQPAVDPSEEYEHRDANTSDLLKFGLGLIVVLIVVLISMKWMFSYFAKSQPLGPPASPFENVRVLPPQPRLQVKPGADLRSYCSDQMQKLGTYGWVDQGNGVVRIPIDRAIDATIERGLPARPASEAHSSAPSVSVSREGASSPNGPCAYWVPEDAKTKSQNLE
jgi:hypothetical protein